MIGEQEGNESAEQIHMPNAESLSATQDPDIQAKCYGTIDFFFLALLHLKRHLNEREMINEQPSKTCTRINKWETSITNLF